MNTFVIELAQTLPVALETLRVALAAEKMSIVSEVDVQAIFKTKLGHETVPTRLLGVCEPAIARALLEAEPDIGAQLPCGCSATELRPGITRIAMQDPRVIAAFTGVPAARDALERARATLLRVVASLQKHAL